MSLDLCEMALQQTQELLRLTDVIMQSICTRCFSKDDLYLEVLGRVLGGKGRRGPDHILVVTQENTESLLHGRIYHLNDGRLVERSEEISIEATSSYAENLTLTGVQDDEIAVNWIDSFETIEDFQSYIHPSITAVMDGPVKNFVTSRISGNSHSAIIAFNYPGRATAYDANVLRSVAVAIGSFSVLAQEVSETEKAFVYTIEALARACEAAEEDTGRHILRVNRYSGALAANMGLSSDFVDAITYSAQMHDVGKIKIPTTILLKKRSLTKKEMQLIKMHPAYGKTILGNSPRLAMARDIAIAHHENWDGSGYPFGLKGVNIPLSGRIVKIADVYDALRSRRSYKDALSHREVLDVFRNGDNRIQPGHFDPDLLALFLKIEQMFESIYASSKSGEAS